MAKDNWKYTLIGLVVFFAICFFLNWLGDIRCKKNPEKCYECQDPRNRTSDKLPDCPSWMLNN